MSVLSYGLSRFARPGFFLRFACYLLLATGLLTACQRAVQTPDLPLPNLRIAVAPFTQPTRVTELMAGYIPADQRIVEPKYLQQLDFAFIGKLEKISRSFIRLAPENLGSLGEDRYGRRSALATWTKAAKQAGAEIIIVPQLVDLRENEGDSGETANIHVDFFLIDARGEGELVQRSRYTAGAEAIRRKSQPSAFELAEDGMDFAILEFGL